MAELLAPNITEAGDQFIPDPSGSGAMFLAQAPEIPKIKGEDDYKALPANSIYFDPTGQKRRKPVATPEDYEGVPEGTEYVDPEGQTRQKPRYQGVGFSTQTLYDMALTDKEREKILERAYPGKIKKDHKGEPYVDDEGTLRRPGRGVETVSGFLTASAAPTTGAVLGALGGGAGGGAVGGPAGAVAGTAIGGASGAMLGQEFNDVVLQLSGVYDRTPAEKLTNLGLAAASGGMGAGVGRGAAALVPSVKAGASALTAALPGLARGFVGAEQEGLRTARGLAEKGVAPPPSGWAKEAPHIQNIVEVFDPAFHTQEPLLQSATEHYERTAKGILESAEIGADVKGSLVNPTQAVSTEEAGVKILQRAREQSAAADAKLQAELEARRTAVREGAAGREAEQAQQVESLRVAEREARQAAQGLIDAGFEDIQRDINGAMKAVQAGHHSGDLWTQVGEKLKAIKVGIQQRAKKMYDEADALAGDHRPNVEGLAEDARAFLEQLPEGFENKYPSIVRQLRGLAGETNEAGEVVREAVQPTFGQLHNLRSVMRSGINYHDLTPDVRDGVYKLFARKVDGILHDVNAVPELKAAATALDSADAFYRDAIRPLTDKNIQAVVSGLESGLPADPKILFDTLVKEGRSDLTSKVRELVGPNLWAGVKAADVQEMMDASKTLVPGQIDGRAFARQVLDRHRSNMLEAVHGREASTKLLEQAQNIEMLNGRLDIGVRPGDTITSVISKARDVSTALKEAAKKDPLALLRKEMAGVEKEHAKKLAIARKDDPLSFLRDPTVGATEAVDSILRSEDLILATAARFGEQSPEFNMLRQIWAQRILQNTMQPGQRLAKVSAEIQQLMFPGVTLDQMKLLAKEMEWLMNTKALSKGDRGAGLSMSAVAKVEHPWSHILGRGGTLAKIATAPTKVIPGADNAGRYLLGKYYGFIRKLATSPATLRWFERGLTGSPEEKAAVRAAISKVLQRGGAVGAGVGESLEQGGLE